MVATYFDVNGYICDYFDGEHGTSTVPYITSKVITNSTYNDDGLVTWELTLPKYLVAELNTHRSASRNSASARAVPTKSFIGTVLNNPVLPLFYGSNKRGMAAGSSISPSSKFFTKVIYGLHRYVSIGCTIALNKLGLHKQWANRLLEVHYPTKIIFTMTHSAFKHFYNLRSNAYAQPEMQLLAKSMYNSLQKSESTKLELGDYHLPYSNKYRQQDVKPNDVIISVARCAAVSYRTEDITLDKAKDIYDKLGANEAAIKAGKFHASPFEHVAIADEYCENYMYKNFGKNFVQLRAVIEYNNSIDALFKKVMYA